jgi:hypothetical protein
LLTIQILRTEFLCFLIKFAVLWYPTRTIFPWCINKCDMQQHLCTNYKFHHRIWTCTHSIIRTIPSHNKHYSSAIERSWSLKSILVTSLIQSLLSPLCLFLLQTVLGASYILAYRISVLMGLSFNSSLGQIPTNWFYSSQ